MSSSKMEIEEARKAARRLNTDTAETLFQEQIRVGTVIYVGGAIHDEGVDDLLEDFLEEEEVWPFPLGDAELDRLMSLVESSDWEDVGAWLARKRITGFLVKLFTPTQFRDPEYHGGVRMTWGACDTTWVYLDDWSDLEEKALDWKGGLSPVDAS